MQRIYRGLSQWLGGHSRLASTPTLGAREIEVMKILWEHGELSAQHTLDKISSDRLSLSTLQSTLERLYRKQLVTRRKDGRSYLYSSAVSQSDVISRFLQEIAAQLSNGDIEPMVSGFMSYMAEDANKALTDMEQQKLQALVSKK